MAHDWYASPLYYDIIFDQDTALEADFVEAAFRRYARPAGKRRLRVLEPAAGSGRLMVELARRGHAVSGFDLEPAMVEFTRGRLASAGLSGEMARGRMERFDLGAGRFDLAHCFVSTFKYLLTERAARAHLRCVARGLRRGGIYLLGFHLSDYGAGRGEAERWVGRRGGVRVDCRIDSDPPDPEARTERVRSSLRVHEAGRRHRVETAWDFRTYDAAQVRSMLAAVPEFELVACHDFRYALEDERTLDDDWEDVILVLRKR